MKTALWIVQGLLSIAFLISGAMKIVVPHAELVEQMAWASRVSEGMVKFIGIMEVLGAVGIILPSALRIMPRLTNVSAVGFVVIMVLAAANHALAGEISEIFINIVLMLLAGFVAWGRMFKHPIQPRS